MHSETVSHFQVALNPLDDIYSAKPFNLQLSIHPLRLQYSWYVVKETTVASMTVSLTVRSRDTDLLWGDRGSHSDRNALFIRYDDVHHRGMDVFIAEQR